MRLRFLILISVWLSGPLHAYGPIFASRLQLPGAETFNYALAIRDMPHGTEIENSLVYGISAPLAVGVKLPFLINEGSSDIEINQGSLEGIYRFYNRDGLASKHAGVINLTMDIVGRRRKGPDLYPIISAGYLVDYRKWISIAGARIDRKAGSLMSDMRRWHNGDDNDHAFWTDGTVGWRFYQASDRPMDAMLALSGNLRLDGDAAGFLAPEIIVQPEARWLMKLGYRGCIFSGRDRDLEHEGVAFELEIRF